MWLKVIIGAVVIWLLFFHKKAQAASLSGVIQPEGQPDFDPASMDGITTDQLKGVAAGDVSIGDEWSATFVAGDGNWADAYRTHAAEPDDPGGMPL